MYIAFDDTDGRDGGCTTSMVMPILKQLPHLVLMEPPRLIRLNPNVPWKTRGNGAVAIRLGHKQGQGVPVGAHQNKPIHYYPEAVPAQHKDINAEQLWQLINTEANTHNDAKPSLILTEKPLDERIYWHAVRDFITPEDNQQLEQQYPYPENTIIYTTENTRSIIGCRAVLAWNPEHVFSYEHLSYRKPNNIGTPRKINPEPLHKLDETTETFCTYDTINNKLACIPNTPCPVLMGVRGQNYTEMHTVVNDAIQQAAQQGEGMETWFIFQSNQASGDHVKYCDKLTEAEPYTTITTQVVLTTKPETQPGGHVAFQGRAVTDREEKTFMAFEPSKQFRNYVRKLEAGDDIIVIAAYKKDIFALEKFKVVCYNSTATWGKPECCGRPTKNKGQQNYVCRECKQKCQPVQIEPIHTDLPKNIWYEPPIMSRRHLHRSIGMTAPKHTHK